MNRDDFVTRPKLYCHRVTAEDIEDYPSLKPGSIMCWGEERDSMAPSVAGIFRDHLEAQNFFERIRDRYTLRIVDADWSVRGEESC